MNEKGPIKVAVIGGGCASLAAAFELTKPKHRGRYEVTVYQLGWRLGGKGASGRGPAGRIEEHGLHVWMGFYENAFRLIRQCYGELGRDPKHCRIADWDDAFFPDPFVGVTDRDRFLGWMNRTACFPPAKGLPGDPLDNHNPFSVASYLAHAAALLRMLLTGVDTHPGGDSKSAAGEPLGPAAERWDRMSSSEDVLKRLNRMLKYGLSLASASLAEAAAILEVVCRSLPTYPQNLVLKLLEMLAANARKQLERVIERDEDLRYQWEITDLVLAMMVGIVRFGLVFHPRGFEAIDDYESLDWLRLNGASERSLNSAFVKGLYDLIFAYGGAGVERPGLAAGQGLRASLRMLFTYRGAIFWKMRAGMGDVVFAPLYEVLRNRGVSFEFFHRLTDVELSRAEDIGPDECPYVKTLHFDVQAKVRGGGEYRPLIDVGGVPCWPSEPDYEQLVSGKQHRTQHRQYESHWDRRSVARRHLAVGEDFDFVVLGVSVGEIPYVCRDILARDQRWRDMVEHVATIPTQAFQVWMREDMESLGWSQPAVNVSGYVEPFNTWADMRQLIPEEQWPVAPGAIAYFCNALADPPAPPAEDDVEYPARRREEVRLSAIRYLSNDVATLWPKAVDEQGEFRWGLLMDPAEEAGGGAGATGEDRFDSQFWTANVNPTDRYVLARPGTLKYRISPLDNSYDNLTIAGDWTDAGFNEGCVETAVMSGLLAAHAISGTPAIEEIVGYDHP